MKIQTYYGNFKQYKDLLYYMKTRKIDSTTVVVAFGKENHHTITLDCEELESISKFE